MIKNMMREKAISKIKDFNPKNIISAYLGKAGRCMCGCCGDYAYASNKVVQAGKDRGYDIMEDEISDKKVIGRFKKMLKNIEFCDEVFFEDDHFGIEYNNRTIVCYY